MRGAHPRETSGPSATAEGLDDLPLLGGDARGDGDRLALLEPASGVHLTYRALRRSVRTRAETLRAHGLDGRSLILLLCHNDRATVLDYLAALAAGVPIALLPASISPSALEELRRAYQPELILGPGAATVSSLMEAVQVDPSTDAVPFGAPWAHRSTDALAVPASAAAIGALRSSAQPALLLSTSGSTGSPKMVRLSLSALLSNARAIASSLSLSPDDVAPTSLPLSYSYGLSILNSHLVAGATLLLTDESLLSEPFWAACREHSVTSLAGVPYSYQLLRRLDLARLAPPSLRTFTQAGGRMEPAMVLHFHRLASSRDGRLFIMYGQTEATARITILPSSELPDHAGSVGRPISGHLSLADDGEVLYHGPNVMLGYAQQRADVLGPDQHRGTLATGDLGRLDDAGRLWITGRKRRIAKVFGMRLGLDELESWLRADLASRPAASAPSPIAAAVAPADGRAAIASSFELAAVATAERVLLFFASPAAPLSAEEAARWRADLQSRLAEHTGLHPSGFAVRQIDALPLLSGGKIDYPALEAHKERAP